MSLLETTKSAIENAVALINEIGVECFYLYKDEVTPILLKILIREMGVSELVADYRQGDMKVELPAASLPSAPKKYDTIQIGDKKYAVKDDATPRRVGNIVYTYRFVVRG